MATAPTPWLDESRRRRAAAEADEIALRAVHRRQDGVPVHDFAPGGDPFVIYGVPEAAGPGSGRRPIAWGAVFIWIWVVAVVLFGLGLGWMIGQLDGKTMLDLLSPTAVQAREAGWVSISEGL
ncbi:hypothetical protein LO749_09340 [Paracoccus denitrificans]|uniref:hypothetical protein n=1 Tax=Paracoccus denitrificans TaxID=266 RepID=UPI001E2FF2BC|nr:hypothetical protein [Paracoccus denitrificans]UFS64371.1 hypothetical protein LO749_09340 [Paracoccus denitrificans]